MKNRRIISCILSLCVTLLSMGGTYAHASVLQTEKGKFITEGNYNKNENVSLVVRKDNGALNVDNFNNGVSYIAQETVDVNGFYSHKFSLPESTDDGEYTISTEGKSGKNSESFYYSNKGVTQLYEQFTNANIWNCKQMQIIDGRLNSTAATQTYAGLRGGADNYLKNFKLRFNMMFTELSTGDPWFMVSVRTGSGTMESFLIRTGVVRRYFDGVEYAISGNGEWNMSVGTKYNIEIECNDLNMKITLFSDSGETIYTGEYQAQGVGYGGLSFSTSASAVSIDNIAVINTEASNTLLCEKNKSIKTGDTYKFRLYNAVDGIKWSIDNPDVATVTADGTVTAKQSGDTVLSVTDNNGNILDKSPINVYDGINSITVSQKNITITKGESISVSCTLNGGNSSDLKWSSSDNNVAKMFGNAYTSKTITGVSEGTALITVSDSEATASSNIKVIVLPEQKATEDEAAFSVSSPGIEISPYLFGVHHYYTDNSNEARKALSDVGFDLMRTMKLSSEWSFPIATELLKCPQMCVVPFEGKSNEEIMAEIDDMKEAVGSQKLYIELGNEVYTYYSDAEEYMKRCQEIYPIIKEKYPTIEIGVVIVPDSLKYALPNTKYSKWNDIVAKYPESYDAVIVHNYTTINNVDGYSTNDMMQQLYLDNQFIKSRFSNYKELFAGKSIWVSEYGNLIMDVFNSADLSEQSRKSFAKTTGVAICNIEKLFDMAAEGVDISCYHMFNDAQGFGIIQGSEKLQNYYLFKKAGEILENNNYFYDVSPILCNKTDGHLNLVNETFISLDDVGAWGFGNENGVKYIALSNRTYKNKKISLKNLKIKKLWSYGENDGNPLQNYLTCSGLLSDMPQNVEQPKEYNAEFENYIDINGYSLVICEVQNSTEATVVCNASNDWNFEKDGSPILAVDNADFREDSFTMYCNGVEIPIKCTFAQNTVQIAPSDGWKYDSAYKIVCDNAIGGREFNFTTVKMPEEKRYEKKLSESSLEIGNWNYTKIAGEWRDFMLTFDVEWSSESEYLQVEFRGGFIRLMKNSQNRYSYFNGNNDARFGRFDGFSENTENVKLVVTGNCAKLYEKLPDDELYSFVGMIDHIEDIDSLIGFNGPANCTIKNLQVNAPKTIANTRIYQKSGNEKIYTNKILRGENFIDITIDKSTLKGGCQVIVSILKDKRIHDVVLPSEVSEGQYQRVYNCQEDSETINVFLWNSLKEMMPLDESYILE